MTCKFIKVCSAKVVYDFYKTVCLSPDVDATKCRFFGLTNSEMRRPKDWLKEEGE